MRSSEDGCHSSSETELQKDAFSFKRSYIANTVDSEEVLSITKLQNSGVIDKNSKITQPTIEKQSDQMRFSLENVAVDGCIDSSAVQNYSAAEDAERNEQAASADKVADNLTTKDEGQIHKLTCTHGVKGHMATIKVAKHIKESTWNGKVGNDLKMSEDANQIRGETWTNRSETVVVTAKVPALAKKTGNSLTMTNVSQQIQKATRNDETGLSLMTIVTINKAEEATCRIVEYELPTSDTDRIQEEASNDKNENDMAAREAAKKGEKTESSLAATSKQEILNTVPGGRTEIDLLVSEAASETALSGGSNNSALITGNADQLWGTLRTDGMKANLMTDARCKSTLGNKDANQIQEAICSDNLSDLMISGDANHIQGATWANKDDDSVTATTTVKRPEQAERSFATKKGAKQAQELGRADYTEYCSLMNEAAKQTQDETTADAHKDEAENQFKKTNQNDHPGSGLTMMESAEQAQESYTGNTEVSLAAVEAEEGITRTKWAENDLVTSKSANVAEKMTWDNDSDYDTMTKGGTVCDDGESSFTRTEATDIIHDTERSGQVNSKVEKGLGQSGRTSSVEESSMEVEEVHQITGKSSKTKGCLTKVANRIHEEAWTDVAEDVTEAAQLEMQENLDMTHTEFEGNYSLSSIEALTDEQQKFIVATKNANELRMSEICVSPLFVATKKIPATKEQNPKAESPSPAKTDGRVNKITTEKRQLQNSKKDEAGKQAENKCHPSKIMNSMPEKASDASASVVSIATENCKKTDVHLCSITTKDVEIISLQKTADSEDTVGNGSKLSCSASASVVYTDAGGLKAIVSDDTRASLSAHDTAIASRNPANSGIKSSSKREPAKVCTRVVQPQKTARCPKAQKSAVLERSLRIDLSHLIAQFEELEGKRNAVLNAFCSEFYFLFTKQ